MDITEELLKKHSKKQALHIAAYINDDQEKFESLVKIFLGGSYRVTQRAAQVLNICFSQNPALIVPHLSPIISNLENPVHDAVIRNTLGILQYIDIPEEMMGVTCELGFEFLLGKYPVAIKAFAMTVLYNISIKFPELQHELKIAIEDQMPYSSAGFRSRGSKILKKMERKSKVR